MPFIRSLISKRRACMVAVILLLSKILPTYSRYMLKGLVDIIIITLLSRQPSSCIKCIKLNIRLLYNVKSISNARYMFFMRLYIL